MNMNHSEPLFDLSYLNQIFQGNQEMVNNIIQLFLEQVPEYVGEMEDCIERDDLLALHPLAHKAKSSISMLGLTSMERNILDIERFSKEHIHLEQLPSLVAAVRNECNVVFEQLSARLGSSSA